MDPNKINLEPGEWLYVNCGETPSEKNCKLVIMAPVDQKDDLMKAEVEHMVSAHGHSREEAENIAKEVGNMTKTITVA